MSFESADDRELNDWHERLNVLWRNVASPHVALWTHLVRRRDRAYPESNFTPGFARQLNQKYRQRLQSETLMVNDWYLTVVFRPARSTAHALTVRAPAPCRSRRGSRRARRGCGVQRQACFTTDRGAGSL